MEPGRCRGDRHLNFCYIFNLYKQENYYICIHKFNSVMKQNIETRQFAGQTEFTLDYSTPQALEASKKNRHFHQRMLRAYLKGKQYFHFGRHYEASLGKYVPTQHEVLVK